MIILISQDKKKICKCSNVQIDYCFDLYRIVTDFGLMASYKKEETALKQLNRIKDFIQTSSADFYSDTRYQAILELPADVDE